MPVQAIPERLLLCLLLLTKLSEEQSRLVDPEFHEVLPSLFHVYVNPFLKTAIKPELNPPMIDLSLSKR
jgi:hypothetical protein